MNFKEMAEQAARQGAVEELTPKYVEFKDVGATIIGRLKGFSPVESGLSSKPYNQYLFETDDGLIKCAFGAATDKEAGMLMLPGHIYNVVYQGNVKITGGRTVNKFQITHIIEEMVLGREPEGGENNA